MTENNTENAQNMQFVEDFTEKFQQIDFEGESRQVCQQVKDSHIYQFLLLTLLLFLLGLLTLLL